MKREKWANRSTFILAAVGSAVGLGNAWRFPGQAAKYGGGTFLVVYLIALIIAGFPLLLMELTIGRKMQKGAPGTFRGLGKKMEWVGWASTGTAFVISCYYAAVLAWVLVMIVKSFSIAFSADPGSIFVVEVLQASSGPMDLGGFSVPVLIALVVAWGAIWWCIRDGAKSVGKIVKYTVFAPVVLLLVLCINGFTLPGAIDGLKHYLIPQWSEFLNPQVWIGAFGQVFYSLSIMMAIMITYGSFLQKGGDLKKDTLWIVLSDAAISFLAGLVIFTTLGYMANVSGTAFSVPEGGIGLAFVVYPTVLAALPGGPIVQTIIAALFYLTLLTLAIDSAFSIVEAVSTAVADKFYLNKKKTTIGCCIAAGIISLLFATKAGLYWLDIVDQWANSVNLILVGVLECIAVGWVFGIEKVRVEINKTAAKPIGKWFNVTVKFICPVAFSVMLVMFLVNTVQNGYEGYPTSALFWGGWLVSVLVFAGSFLIQFITKKNKKLAEKAAAEPSWDELIE